MPRSFQAVVGRAPRVLILGSMPGKASLRAGRYYAHPRNQFWRLLGTALGEDLAAMSYSRRLAALKRRGVALWDVIASCRRAGSLDTAIRGERPNQVAALVRRAKILAVFLNGGKAASSFRRFVARNLPSGVRVVRLPSSSPAAAAVTFARKARAWRRVADRLV